MVEAVKPRILSVATPGEVTRLTNGYGSPLEVAPAMGRVATIDVAHIGSAESDIAHLSKEIADAIHERYDEHDGFVVTARRADLGLIAPRLAFAFGPGLDKTIALTGSVLPASEPHSEANIDLVKATMAASAPFGEVVIVSGNSVVGGTSFMYGDASPSSSPSYQPYETDGQLGIISDVITINHPKEAERVNINGFNNEFETRVLSIALTPGLEPEPYRQIIPGRKGVAIEALGWGVTLNGPFSFFGPIHDATDQNIPVIITNRAIDNGPLDDDAYLKYASLPYDEQGVTPVRRINPDVAVAKFSWVLKRVEKEIASGKLTEEGKLKRVKELMLKPYVGEFGANRAFTDPTFHL